MSIFGLILDDNDLRDSSLEPQNGVKKANLAKRLKLRFGEKYHKMVQRANEEAEAAKKLNSKWNWVSLPQRVKKITDVQVQEASSPPRQIRRISPPVTSVTHPVSVEEESGPRLSIQSEEIEMYTSPDRTRAQEAAVEPEDPVVIPSSPVAMEESPFTPKRPRSPIAPPMAPPMQAPVVIEPQQPVPAPQQPVQQLHPVPGRRILRANRTRRTDELPAVDPNMGDSMMQMGSPIRSPPRTSLLSFGATSQSFTNPSVSGNQSVPRSSFGSQSGVGSFQQPSPNPFMPNLGSGSRQSFSNPFQGSAFGSDTQSQSPRLSFQSNAPVFQAQPSPQNQPQQPFQQTQQFNANNTGSFSFGQASAPVTRRNRGRRKSRP